MEKGPDGVAKLEFELPPKEIMSKLLDNIEAQLPREDHVKYDSRAKKLDWEKIRVDGYNSEQCKKLWYYVQDRIRRFRIMAELIPDARTWISQPWTNFYKSKDHNRHPDMPKKPLSMYMLFYSEKREEILRSNSQLSMPEVAKICSEQYQKLSDKKKAKYKQRCDDMRRQYEEKLAAFYANYPELKPVKAEKMKKVKTSPIATPVTTNTNSIPLMPYQNLQQQQGQVISIGTGQNQQLINVLPLNQVNQDPLFVQVQPQQQYQPQFQQPQPQQQLHQPQQQQHQMKPAQQQQQLQQQQQQNYPAAPEKPARAFDLFFKYQMDSHSGETNFDRQSYAEQCRQEWKTMKVKKKAKWIKKAVENYREYEEKVADFMVQNPGYVRPAQKNFLTQEEQRILDKFMGRPEKPPSSSYSFISKEMLNNVEIKKFPSKDRMAQISEKWKLLPQEQKDNYQAEVNRSMGVYRQKYEDWFNALNETERKAETARMNSSKTMRKAPVTKVAGATAVQEPPKIVNVPSNVTPAGPAFSLANLTPVMVQPQMSMMQQPVTMQVIPTAAGKDRQQLLDDILKREPVEPARSAKQLFTSEWLAKHKKKKQSDAKEAWKGLDKKEKKKWHEKLEPQRQKYIEDYTVFVRGLDKEELEMYTELKQKRDEEEEGQNDSSDSESDSSESDESDSDSESDSDI